MARESSKSPESMAEVQPKPAAGRWLVPAILLVAMLALGIFGRSYWSDVERTIAGLGFSGYLLFYGVFVVLTVACMPVSLLGFSAGVLFGPIKGFLVVYPAALTSGLVMFWLGKGLLRGRILDYISTRPKLQALDRLAGNRALRLNLLARLSPLNYGVSCYTLAVGRSTVGVYLVGLLGIMPSIVMQVWLGSLGSAAGRAVSGEPSMSRLETVLLIVGLIFFAVLSWQVGRLVRQAWRIADDDSRNQPGPEAR